jgi:outer membrane protein TolC
MIAMPLILGACASPNIDNALASSNEAAREFTAGKLVLVRDQKVATELTQRADQVLSQPLGQDGAVEIALINSPALQAMLADRWAERARLAQAGRLPNPVLAFERITVGDELEIGRLLTFGLLDVLTLPQRSNLAAQRLAAADLALTAEVVGAVSGVRQAWVRAVAAQQSLAYAQQVHDSAQASAELAKRMQAAGNFNRITRARQQTFHADAAAGLAIAQHEAAAARESLIRMLGLSEVQAQKLVLPERLPDLPPSPREPTEVAQAATRLRLDLQIAQAQVRAAAREQGLGRLTSVADVEFGLRRNSVSDRVTGERSSPRGWEADVRLPLFDWGDAQRAAFNAQTLAAMNRLEDVARSASSHLREGYSAYRTSYDIARHYRDEVVPLRRVISEENQLRYNGMLIGVFELLADSRDQIAAVRAAIKAQEQFWLADAALRATIVGKPMAAGAGAAGAAAAPDAAPH